MLSLLFVRMANSGMLRLLKTLASITLLNSTSCFRYNRLMTLVRKGRVLPLVRSMVNSSSNLISKKDSLASSGCSS
mgnify:CR=1 FL=1